LVTQSILLNGTARPGPDSFQCGRCRGAIEARRGIREQRFEIDRNRLSSVRVGGGRQPEAGGATDRRRRGRAGGG